MIKHIGMHRCGVRKDGPERYPSIYFLRDILLESQDLRRLERERGDADPIADEMVDEIATDDTEAPQRTAPCGEDGDGSPSAKRQRVLEFMVAMRGAQCDEPSGRPNLPGPASATWPASVTVTGMIQMKSESSDDDGEDVPRRMSSCVRIHLNGELESELESESKAH